MQGGYDEYRAAKLKLLMLIAIIASCETARAAVSRIEIASRADVSGGKTVRGRRSLREIVGKCSFRSIPRIPATRRSPISTKAPRDAGGRVEFSADLYVLAPRTPRAATALHSSMSSTGDAKNILRDFNHAPQVPDPTAERIRDGFLMRQGYTLVWVRMAVDIPRAAADGASMRRRAPIRESRSPARATAFTPNEADPNLARRHGGYSPTPPSIRRSSRRAPRTR